MPMTSATSGVASPTSVHHGFLTRCVLTRHHAHLPFRSPAHTPKCRSVLTDESTSVSDRRGRLLGSAHFSQVERDRLAKSDARTPSTRAAAKCSGFRVAGA